MMIGFVPAVRVSDMCTGVGPPDTISMGSFSVMIGREKGARHFCSTRGD